MKRTKQQVVTELRCSEIIDAGRALFTKRGYQDVTIDEIAAEAGLAKATVYQYFSSKQDIYLAALWRGVDELMAASGRNIEAAQGAQAKIRAFVMTRLEYHQKNRDFFAVYYQEFAKLHPASMSQEFRKLYRQQIEQLRSILAAGITAGELREVNADVLAVAIYESTRGLMMHRSMGGDGLAMEQQAEALLSILWSGAAAAASTKGQKKGGKSH